MGTTPVTRSPERDPLSVQIGSAARKARLRLQLSQEDVAERVGVATEVYGRLERGELRPSTPTLVKLSRALGVSADILLGLSHESAPTSETSEVAADPALSAEFRRLRRTLRTLDRLQLSTFRRMAGVLVFHSRRRRRSRGKARATVT